MCTQKKWYRQLFILPLCFLLFTACNQDEPKEPSDAKVEGENSPDPALVAMSGTLDILYVDTSAFNKLEDGKRVLFCHAYRPVDKLLTLDGWITKGNPSAPINLPPDVKLLKWKTGTLTIDQNLYIGNVFIDKKDIKTIKDAYNKSPKYKYVVFEPYIASEHIVYKIHVSNDPPLPAVPSPKPFVDTGVEANPSPPRDN